MNITEMIKKAWVVPVLASIAFASGSGSCNTTDWAVCVDDNLGNGTDGLAWAGINVKTCISGQSAGQMECSEVATAECHSRVYSVDENGGYHLTNQSIIRFAPSNFAEGDDCAEE